MITSKFIVEPNTSDYSRLKVKEFSNVSATVCSKKISDLNLFSRFKLWISEKIFGREFVKINIGNDTTLLKISDLTESLGISKKELIEADKENKTGELIFLGLESKHYKVSYSVIQEYKNRGDLEKFHNLEKLADSLNLPLHELINADKAGNLQEILKQAQEVENRCAETFRKLDILYEEVNGKLITKGTFGEILTKMEPSHFETMKHVIRSAYKVLQKHPIGQEQEVNQIIQITKNHHILAKSSADSFQITTLFGKLLGHGAYGVAAQTINLLEGNFNTENNAVVKIPQMMDQESKSIIKEFEFLKIIHGNTEVLGIQKPLTLVRNVFSGTERHCHIGSKYETDLFEVLLRKNRQIDLKQEDRISMVYQLIHGVAHIHNKGIINGDIKLENIFCNLTNPDQEIGPLLFIADFGDGLNMSSLPETFTSRGSEVSKLKQDDLAAEQAHSEGNYDLYAQIEKKADVFSSCVVMCSIFTNEQPYNSIPGSGKFQIKDNLKQKLIDSGLSQKTIQLLMLGLDLDYTKRPNATTILEAVKEDLVRITPERSEILLKQSLPLN